MYSLIVVDYCSMEKTIKYIEHVKKMILDIPFFHAVIVDNAEKENGLELCKEKWGESEIRYLEKKIYIFRLEKMTVVYCHAGENLGYARGNNLGVYIARETFQDKYYLISNNDLVIKQKISWKRIEKVFSQDSRIAVVGPQIIGLNGEHQSPQKRVGAFNYLIASYWMKYFFPKWKSDLDYDGQSKACYRLMGCFLFVKAEPFEKVNGFDPKTFMYAEEMILSEKLRKYNYYCYYWNDMIVIHEHGATTKKTSSILQNLTWSFQSCFYYYEKYRHTSFILLFLAKINFNVYKMILKIAWFIKGSNKK